MVVAVNDGASLVRIDAEHLKVVAGHKFGPIRMRRLGAIYRLYPDICSSRLERRQF